VRGEVAVELASRLMPLTNRSSAPTDASAESFAGAAPLTMKLAPGNAWNNGMRMDLTTTRN
jgi:hypothetical protein